ncbi:LysM peptidoglycan-binding domain-containing protein [Aliivibrio fischeri]|uniref:LysM peptidoglycan-binding domain-containing protein n=1 Tax=Aliivibrio fischeri TaxID=668 RepID=UPI0012DA6F1F|nr:LysM peptidoglycan-binding domain-containing protein [Aliivibrio fischeri]MUK65224.1 LysM peptidoglycan-binding domain-containing protein [Aliivibrio fischeri]
MKAWDEKLEDFVDLDELESEITKPKKQPTYRNAFYKPVEDGFITPEQKAKQEQPHNEPVAEKSDPVAAYEYNIEIACAQEDLVTYQIGAFSLGKTDNEPLISSWKKSASQAGFTLLTASIMVNEPKTLYREFFSLSGQALSFKEVTPVKKGVGTHTESFVPIKTAVQVGEQLGWPTAGFYYHFVDDKLAHEYQIVGNDASTFFVTQSSVDQLSSSLLSDHQYNFILLPWKINNSPVTRQHLLYLPQKMTQQEFAELNATWLDENTCLLDVETIVKSKNESVLVREKTDNDSVTYVIQSGDSLWKIAHQQGTTIEKLVELNPQYKGKEGQIKVGDTLVIELKKNENTAASAHVVVLNGDGNRETWDEIAKQHCMAPKELLKLNPMFEDNPSVLKVGDELCVNDSQQAQDKEERITLPPIVLTHIGQVSSFVNSFSTMSKRLLNAFVVAALSDKNIPANTPIVNVGKLEIERHWCDPIKNPMSTNHYQNGGECAYWGLFGEDMRREVNRPHRGLDLFAEIGTDVYACVDAVIQHVRFSSSNGNLIVLKIDEKKFVQRIWNEKLEYKVHSLPNRTEDVEGKDVNVRENGLRFAYMHLNSIEINPETGSVFKAGDKVQKGQIIAKSGVSGIKTGTKAPHLHFEVSSEHEYGNSNTKINPGFFVDFKYIDQQSVSDKEKQSVVAKTNHKSYKGISSFKWSGDIG